MCPLSCRVSLKNHDRVILYQRQNEATVEQSMELWRETDSNRRRSMTPSLATKIDWLFHHVLKSGEQPYSCQEIATRIEASCPGFTVSPSQIWNLRHGISDNPSWKLIIELSKAFAVSSLYFVDDTTADQAVADLYVLTTLKSRGVLDLTIGLARLSPLNTQIAANLITYLATLEQPSLAEAP